MATARFRRLRPAPDEDPERRIAAVVTGHSAQLLRVARASSLCTDDAQDALQRALEIYVRRLDTVEPATEIAWLKVVVRHEAMAIRRSRQDSVAGEEIDFDAQSAATQRDVEEHVAGSERVGRSAEALRALKPDEATALLLKAQGHSYEEIGARQGWTYTKVNRSITEGRRRFLKVYRGIEAGEECDRLAPALAALVDGTARAEQLLAIRPHLRHCSACRATVRDLHPSWRGRVAAWLPLPALLAPLRWLDHAPRGEAPAAEDLVRRASDVAPVLPSSPVAPAAGDGFTQAGLRAVEHADQASRWRLGGLRAEAHQLLHRLLGSDVATGAQLSAGTGGGRGMGIAAILGVCVTGGAGTYCAVTGTLPDPVGIVQEHGEADRRERAEARAQARRAEARRRRAPRPAKDSTAYVIPRATPAPAVTPERRTRRTRRTSTASRPARQATTPPSSTRSAPTAPSQPAKQEFGFEAGTASSGSAAAAPAPSSGGGGGEFDPPAASGGGGSSGGGGGGSGGGGGEFGFE